jgi:hypothetical protein
LRTVDLTGRGDVICPLVSGDPKPGGLVHEQVKMALVP